MEGDRLSAKKTIVVGLFLIGCAHGNWRVAATRATGLCTHDEVVITPMSAEDMWRARCDREGTYICRWSPNSSVLCDYEPICGNDGRSDQRYGNYAR